MFSPGFFFPCFVSKFLPSILFYLKIVVLSCLQTHCHGVCRWLLTPPCYCLYSHPEYCWISLTRSASTPPFSTIVQALVQRICEVTASLFSFALSLFIFLTPSFSVFDFKKYPEWTVHSINLPEFI